MTNLPTTRPPIGAIRRVTVCDHFGIRVTRDGPRWRLMGVVTMAEPMRTVGLDEATYRQHASRLMALASAVAGPSAAEEVVAAATVRAMTSHAWTSVRDPGAYLTRAVVNEARSRGRSERRRLTREAKSSPSGIVAAPHDPDLEVRTALLGLPLRQRAVVFLTYWSDLPAAAVADELGISEGSVHKHLARARATLRDRLSMEDPS